MLSPLQQPLETLYAPFLKTRCDLRRTACEGLLGEKVELLGGEWVCDQVLLTGAHVEGVRTFASPHSSLLHAAGTRQQIPSWVHGPTRLVTASTASCGTVMACQASFPQYPFKQDVGRTLL